jgi:hypothetical protein
MGLCAGWQHFIFKKLSPFTPQSPDEADLLGDRIAIMVEGKLRTVGTSLFLKSRFGVGYHMTLVKAPICDVSHISAVIDSHVHGAVLTSDVGAELTCVCAGLVSNTCSICQLTYRHRYILPKSESPRFAKLFDELEVESQHLGIQSYGVSVTTMEEVFLRVGSGESTQALLNRAHATKRLDSQQHLQQSGAIAVPVAPLLPKINNRTTGWALRKFVHFIHL